MKMSKKEYAELIQYRIDFINLALNEKYVANYTAVYGGWNLLNTKTGRQYKDRIGFDSRKNNAEMLAYVDGIYNLLTFYNAELL